MSSVEEEKDASDDWGGAITSAISEGGEDEDDGPGINVLAGGGLAGAGHSGDSESEELPYVLLLNAAVSMVQTGEITTKEYVEGVSKLDAIADNALKLYAIPAVKKDLPGKLTSHQNSLLEGLETEIHRLKEGLALLLSYPETEAIGDLNVGLETAVSALNNMSAIQKKADAEKAAIAAREKEAKANRAARAAADDDEDDDEDEEDDEDPVA